MEDKRIIKTKKAIYQALKELYLENDFEDISITQLTEKANIGRKTFYLHYSSIDDIVDEIVKKLYDTEILAHLYVIGFLIRLPVITLL